MKIFCLKSAVKAAIAVLLLCSSAISQEKSVYEFDGKKYFLTGAEVEIATWQRGALGVYTIIHDDYGSSSSAGIYDHMDSVLTNRGLIGGPGAITDNCEPRHWRHAEVMLRHGHEIISHSVNHSLGGNQVEMSKKIIEQKIPGYSPLFYVFPFDQWNDEEIEKLKANGYLGARAGNRQPRIDAANAAGAIPHMENPYDFDDPFRLLFEPYPESNSAYKKAPNPNGDKFWFMKPFVEDAVRYNGWSIHEFHGIENMSLSIPLEDYQEWMDWIKVRSDNNEIWMDGPTNVIKYRFAREYAGRPELTQNGDKYTITFGTPVNQSGLEKYNTNLTIFFKTTGITKFIAAVQDGDTIPSKRVSDNYFRVDANPMGGAVTITPAAKEWKKYPFLDPFDVIPSTYPLYNAGDVHDQHDTVYYNGKEWSPKWWIQNETPGTGGTWNIVKDVFNIRALTTRADVNGTIEPLGKTLVKLDTNYTVTIIPDEGYSVDYVNINGENMGAITSHTFNNISDNNSVEAVFTKGELTYFTINAVAGANGSISPSGAVPVADGGSKTFTFTGDVGYAVDSLFVNGEYKGDDKSYTVTGVSGDSDIRVVFKGVPTFVVNATARANGTITPSGAITVSETGDAHFVIKADDGFRIKSVIHNEVDKGAQENYAVENVTADCEIYAQFEAIPTFTVSSSAAANGSIYPAGDSVVAEDENITYTITPEAGYEIENIIVDDESKGPFREVTVSNIRKDISVTATFVEEAGCKDMKVWDANDSWTQYSVGDLRADGGKVYECIAVGFSHYRPSGPYGHYGWKDAGNCE